MDNETRKEGEAKIKEWNAKFNDAMTLLTKECELYFKGNMKASIRRINHAENKVLKGFVDKMEEDIHLDIDVEELRSMIVVMAIFESESLSLSKAMCMVLENRSECGAMSKEEILARLESLKQDNTLDEAPCS